MGIITFNNVEIRDDLKARISELSAVDTTFYDGAISSGNGLIVPPGADKEKSTGYIPVLYNSVVNAKVTFNAAHYRSIYFYAYDADKNYLGRIGGTETGILLTYEESATVSYPDAAYVRFCFKTFDDLDSCAINAYTSNSEILDVVNHEKESTAVKLLEKVDGAAGKNLFDKSGERTVIEEGYYRPYNSGAKVALASFEAAIINAEASSNYVVNTANTHVCFFSDESATAYIGGFLANNANGYTFTTPSNVKTMSLSFAIASEDSFQVEKGTVSTSYAPFVFGIYSNQIIDLSKSLHVGQSRDYTTIQSAINAANDGDVIFVDEGVYNEALDMVGKHLHLIGSGRDATIVTFAGDDYYYPPLEASSGIVENMSFITTATEKASGAIDTSYCVHIDYDDEINSSLQFINCYFKSPIRPTVGIGLREGFTLNFTNCKFVSTVYTVYCHEQQASNKTGQRIELVDCSIQCTGTSTAIHLQESREYSGNEVTILMQRCIAKTNGQSVISAVTYPNNLPPTGSNYLNLNSFYLDVMSALNNADILNA